MTMEASIEQVCRQFVDDVVAYAAAHAPADSVIDRVAEMIARDSLLTGRVWYGRSVGAGERAAQRLEAAIRLIEQVGWTQGSYADFNGAVCGHGALANAAVHLTDAYGPAIDCVDLVIRANWGLSCGFMTWNDTPGRKMTEVTDAMRQAAEVARHFGP